MRTTPSLRRVAALLVWFAAAPVASAQGVPRRQIPPTVLTELAILEQRFEAALAADCHPELCYSKGCAYADHAVIDRPRTGSLPGLGGEPGPGSVEPQEFLTRATCAFAYEPTVSATDAEALGRRLQSRVSHAFAVVSVSRQELEPVPPELQLAPAPPQEEPPAEAPLPPAPPRWSTSSAARELWTTLLPHFAWMIAVGLLTAAATVLFWAWRRVGRETVEERALLAQLLREDAMAAATPEDDAPEGEDEPDDDDAFVATEAAAWQSRLTALRPDQVDPELEALVRELLRDRDLPTLAKATLTFPAPFLASFPSGGDVAAAKLDLAEHLKTVDPETLPSDADFYRTLGRVARSATLAGQGDAQLLRSLREDFGASGLVALFATLPPRAGALLFALAPTDQQLELVRLLTEDGVRDLAEQLIRSNRMDDGEANYLFDVLRAARAGQHLPPAPARDLSERGIVFDAAGALSVLLAALPGDARAALFADTLARFNGSLPAWFQGLLYPELLFAVDDQARADLFLEVDADQLAAWLTQQDEATRQRLLSGLPRALRASVESAPPVSRERQLSQAQAARGVLARGLQRQLARAQLSFEQVLSAPDRTVDA
jgi:hypothetical protein